MSRHKRAREIMPQTMASGVQGVQTVAPELPYKEQAEAAYKPEVETTFQPVKFKVVGSFQARIGANTAIVRGTADNLYMYVARSQEIVDWCDKSGFKRV